MFHSVKVSYAERFLVLLADEKRSSLPPMHTVLSAHNMPTAGPGNSTCHQTRGSCLASCRAPCLYKLLLNRLVLYTSQTAHVIQQSQ